MGMANLKTTVGGIIGMLACTACVMAQAADWKEIARTPEGHYSIDNATISRPAKDEVAVWMKIVKPIGLELSSDQSQPAKNFSLDHNPYQLIEKRHYKCQNREFSISRQLKYSKPGTVVADIALAPVDRQAIEVVPDSIDELLLDRICKPPVPPVQKSVKKKTRRAKSTKARAAVQKQT